MVSDIEQILLCELPMAINTIDVCAAVLSDALNQMPIRAFDRCGLEAYEKASTMASVIYDYSKKAQGLIPIVQDDFEEKQQKELLDTIRCDVTISVASTVSTRNKQYTHSEKEIDR